ncbi:Cellulose synthase-like protein D5 [Castilleja foliolosa]|uniref:Cellulose synthase-like protein D5 n=1 Tax=Castilleja foliolosa TaxID=1961234 RepID=A0ABD3EFF8_9LAMI
MRRLRLLLRGSSLSLGLMCRNRLRYQRLRGWLMVLIDTEHGPRLRNDTDIPFYLDFPDCVLHFTRALDFLREIHRPTLDVTFLVFLLAITLTRCMLALLEIKWSGITLHDWWRIEQFWLIGGTNAHPAAVIQGLLKVIAGIEISFTLTSKSSVPDEGEDEFAELYEFRWTTLMIPPITIIMFNMIAIGVAVSRTVYSPFPEWSKLLGGVFFSFWVLSHFLYR